MSGSSESDHPFANVRLNQIAALTDLIRANPTASREYVQRRYMERAVCFEQTLRFLVSIGYVAENMSSFQLKENKTDFVEAPAELMSRLIQHDSACREELQRYFAQFRVVADRLIHQPLAQLRGAESALRNLLMDLRVISHEEESDAYVVCPQYFNLYRDVARRYPAVQQAVVARKRADDEALGEAAELAILRFEEQRVGPEHAKDVIHVSPGDATAGYDIASVTINNGSICPRHIEVKAVPGESLRFYWTANEVEAARKLGSWYFLYLLPVRAPNTFDVDSLLMINDPFRTVLGFEEWRSTPEVYRCELAMSMPAKHSTSCGAGDG